MANAVKDTNAQITALVADATRVARLRAAFGEGCTLARTPAALLAVSRQLSVELVIVTPRDGAGNSLVTTVAAIRASRRSPPVYVYSNGSDENIRELMPLAHAGARGLILAGADDSVPALQKLLHGGTVARAVETVSVAVQQAISRRHIPLVTQCLEHIAAPLPATAFARGLGVSRRTLSAWAAQAGARGIRSLTSKCRVLVALEMIRDSGCAIEHVAHELQFSSSAHLYNTIRRYTGLRPRQAAARDAAHWVTRFFVGGGRAQPMTPGNAPPPGETIVLPAEWSNPPNDVTLPPTNQGVP